MRRATKLLLVGVIAALALGMIAGPALATASGGAHHPKGTQFQRSNQPTVQANTSVRGSSSGSTVAGSVLPFTGAQLTLIALVGLAAIGVGTGLVLRSRRMGWRRALNP